jgi:hypothetical protein
MTISDDGVLISDYCIGNDWSSGCSGEPVKVSDDPVSDNLSHL